MARYSVVNNGTNKTKKRKKTRRIVIILVVIIVCLVVFAFFFYRRLVTPIILDIAQTRLQSETTLALNEAISNVLSSGTDYRDFVTVEKNDQNEIVLLSANSAHVNSLAREISIVAQKQINEMRMFEVEIPIGTLTGIPLLSERGSTVEITVTPIGKVSCDFTSDFISAGINQTLHRIFLNVYSRVDLIIPTSHLEVETVTPILVCESVIVGKVPEVFLQSGLLLGGI